jgi:hypothetical protein
VKRNSEKAGIRTEIRYGDKSQRPREAAKVCDSATREEKASWVREKKGKKDSE